ncbi:glycerol-3-phosphate acyltransferase [Microcoleus sp. FACHB-SPT15]|uniref:glycerol-3-phosphate acyltransferase n=1 Tax=Microcoleus sp. FACHB-SPT15 TaxID=2692830 RepID=UPI00177EF1D0|nr:glycerol-3-phosphate acyltransferase [Microcoleus sp. FACHB-SPT15]MBD1809112.1 glycerol-3-phosphate acyltransferase [Microcoleus sp. FACHB-SPT15]
MTLTQVWGSLLIFTVCPLLGGLPLISWITYALTRRRLAQVGTGNVSVSAAFYHGGRWVGILAVLSEAAKGIAAVLLARYFFPTEPAWELIALIALVMGRYQLGKGAGTTNVVWGIIAHDWVAALFVFLMGGVGFTIFRNRTSGRFGVLILLPLILALLHPQDPARIVAAIALGGVLAWIYQKIPDDLDLPSKEGKAESQQMFRFFRGERAIISLDSKLDSSKVGQKAATLSQLKGWGYSVATGWVLPPGDDPEPLIKYLPVSDFEPLVVRSSAIGEDSEEASAAGQYRSILNVTSRPALQEAITQVLASYHDPTAVQYRRDLLLRNPSKAKRVQSKSPEDSMAVLIQKQVQGVFSGVAFSRDPISQQGDAVVIEGLPGDATRVVSGRVTPDHYQVYLQESKLQTNGDSSTTPDSPLPTAQIEGSGDLPPALIQEVAVLARQLEDRYHGIPQDIEWSYDGQQLWLLQARPITTLQPIWTRKIAAEVIPGLIRPLTWSINRPLTCGVWGEIFTVVLGTRAQGLDFNETATLHYSRAYFNATLLGQIFRRMGLPPESLEFLTRGAKFSKPPTRSTLQNLPGLLRLLGREWSLETDFESDYQKQFAPILSQLTTQPVSILSPTAILERVDGILEQLKRATYYSILAPLSLSLRQAILRVQDTELDNSQTPEVASLRSLTRLAEDTRHLLRHSPDVYESGAALFANLAEIPDGQSILEQFDQFLDHYGYLSEVATDIAVSTWKEDPRPVRQLFTQLLSYPPPPSAQPTDQSWKAQLVQARLNLKGRVTEVYSQLLAHLRYSFVALETSWQQSGLLSEAGDIFFLEFSEIRRLIADADQELREKLPQIVEKRRSQLEQHHQLASVPSLFYGNEPPSPLTFSASSHSAQQLQGIGASAGQVEGLVKVLTNLQAVTHIDRQTILVVPYTDSGWAPLLARAGGLIAEVGGRLSHGAIVAREYGIPAVMDIQNATQLLRDGQRVRIDGQRGIVEIL